MNHVTIKAIVLLSFLMLCLPVVTAAGESTGSGTFTAQDVPDFSSCEFTNSSLNPYCPIWDGEHTQPDPFLVYEVRRNLEESKYGISSLQPPPGSRGLPTKGTVKIPVFLVEFPDALHDPNQTVADVQSKMFGNGIRGDYPYESLKNYYQRSSYNQLTITGNVYGWYLAAHNRSYYQALGAPAGRIALINEILQNYDSQVNFAEYDSDNNGKMDALFIKWSGSDTGWAQFWWACMSTDSSPITVDGVKPYKYVWSWYSRPNGGAFHPQVDIHETGHLLGLPDYYDYDASTGPKGGVGGWDMMDYNWGDHNAFSKYLLGWIDPIVISSGTHQIVLPPSGTSSSNNAVLIMPGAVPDSFGEFFLVQYREKGNGNDPASGGPAKALWVWHVDATLTSGNWTFLYDNSYTTHKLLRLMEADGLEELEAGTGQWDADDFYLPGKTLGPGTIPDSRNYTGSITNVTVTNLQQLVSSMQVDFTIPSSGPSANFNGTPLAGSAPLGVTFTDSSTGTSITNRRWDFGDGNISNYAVSTNPYHTYTSAGTYTVNLTVSNTSGSNSLNRTSYITVNMTPVVPVANFTANVTSGTAPLTVRFTDTSTGTGLSAWKWDFKNDGSIDSTSQSPTYTFSTAGTYTVNLTVTGTAGTDSEIKSRYITVIPLSTIGIYHNGEFHLRNSTEPGSADVIYGYGIGTGIPVIGDWDGNGKTEVGVYDNGTWSLDYNGNGVYDDPVLDRTASFGLAGYKPVVGDWNGDGRTKIGVEKDGFWTIDYNGNYQWDGVGTDRFAGFGQAADIPVVGDWNGDGKAEIGSHKDGFWAVDYNGNYVWDGVVTDRFAGFGQAADIPVVGDWNGNGKAKIGMEINGFWATDYNGNFVWDGVVIDRFAGFGQAADTPVVGDWNGNGKAKIGSFKGGLWAIDHNGNYAWDGAVTDRFASFGLTGDIPVVGTWDGT